jgi:hypothetical protein
MTRVVTSSDLDWTIIRFLRPVNGAPKGVAHVGDVGDGISMRVTRADIVRFAVDQLTDATWVRGMPQITTEAKPPGLSEPDPR